MITAIVAARNDPLLPRTLSYLKPYCPHVVVVDDASTKKLDTTGADEVITNSIRLGPAMSRHKGAEGHSGWLMFCDSHMEFPDGWFDTACQYLDSSAVHELWGAVYRSNVIFDSFWHDTRLVGGADFYFWKHKDLRFSFCDLMPRRPRNEREYDVPMVLGGCYFIHADWFRRMGGFSHMVGYGSEETWMSWNTWLMGGYVRIMGNLQVTHIFQGKTSLPRTFLPECEINRLVVMKRILSPEEYDTYSSWLPVDAMTKQVVEHTNMAGPVNVLDHRHVSQAFNLQSFTDAIELMAEYESEVRNSCPGCHDRRWLIGRQMIPCRQCNPKGLIAPQIEACELRPIKL